MDDRFEAYLSADGVSFGTDDAALLRAISDRGSVSGAARAQGRSRPRALSRLEALEAAMGPLVERRRGGADGGGSRLTDEGRDLLARYDRLRAALSGTAGVPENVLYGTVARTAGELGDVETEVGTVRAFVVSRVAGTDASEGGDGGADVEDETRSSGGGRKDAEGIDGATDDARDDLAGATVQVSVRGDAVTLHAPAEAPESGGTSARNRFSGAVTAVDRGDSVARVALDVGLPDPLCALVTTESVDRLDLRPGTDVVATFKATAIRATVVEA